MKFRNIVMLSAALGAWLLCAEDLAFDAKLTGWKSNDRKQVAFVAGDAKNSPAVRLVNDGTAKIVNLEKFFALEPDTRYVLTFSIKGEGIEEGGNSGARIMLNSGKKWARITSLLGDQPETGSFDWRKGEGIIDTSLFPDSKIKVALNLAGKGTVFFKDLKIEKEASGAAGADSLTDALKFDRKLTGWSVSSGKNVAIDEGTKVGAMSVRITNNGEKKLVQAGKVLALEPNTQYELTFYVKGEGIEAGKNQGARIILNAGKKWERITSLPKNQPETGTFDWRQGRGIIDTSKFPDSRIKLDLNLTGKGTVWFDDLVIVKKKSDSAVVTKGGNAAPSFHKAYTDAIRSAVLVPQGVFGFFAPGEAVKLDLFVDGKAAKYEYTLTVKDDTGKTVFKQEKKTLSGAIELPAQPRGYYSMESDLYADGKKAYTIQGGFAVAPVPGKRDPFFQFGYGVIPELYDGYKRVGCGSIAIKTAWTLVLQHRNAKRTADYLVNHAYKPFLESGDFHLVAALGTSLPKARMRSPEELKRGMPLLSDDVIKVYTDFIAELAPRLKGKVSEWSIGQEIPSNAMIKDKFVGTWSEAMANFVALTRIASRQLKAIDPKIRIAAGGNCIMEKTDDIERIAMGDLVRDFDIYYIDAYTGLWDLAGGGVMIPEIDLMNFYRKASALSVSLGKGKYIANDECGYSINYGAPFDAGLALDQARLTARSLIISKAAPVLCYELHCPNRTFHQAAKSDAERHMSTIWKTIPFGKKFYCVPLPGGAMYVTAATELAFAKFEAEIIGGSIYSYLFTKPDGSTLVTLWNIEKEQPFAVEFPVAASRVLNMYGRDLTGKPLVIAPDPLYITVKAPAAQVAEVMKRAVAANSPEVICTALPGTIFVRSLVKETRDAEIRLPGKAPVKVKLLPGKVAAFATEVPGPGKLAIGSREYEIPLEKIPVHRLRRVSGLAELRKGKPGLLRVPDHVRPLEALHPERCYFRSEGFNPNGNDVSAQYWTGYDDNNFYMAVEVDDPLHLQRYTAEDIWHDDSLQFVLSPTDYPPSAMLSQSEKKPSSEYNFGLALTPKGVQLVKFLGKDAGVKDYPAKVFRKGNTTVYEVVIPWKAVGGKAKRFGFLVWDNNNPVQRKAPYRLELTPGIAGGADSSKLAKVIYE